MSDREAFNIPDTTVSKIQSYEDEIDYLVRHPDQVCNRWGMGDLLFKFCTPDGDYLTTATKEFGCLTQVHSGAYKAWTPELTDLIRATKGIHDSPDELQSALMAADENGRREMLSVYHRLQLHMDETIRR